MIIPSRYYRVFLNIILKIFVCYLVASHATGGEFMGIWKKEPGYAFSGFSGQLLFNGEPASHAKLIRRYELSKPNEFEDSTVADGDGYFSFESILVKYRAPLLASHDFLSHQQIFVEYRGEQYQIWGGGKTQREEYSEFGGKPSNLKCELTEESRRVKNELSGMIGTNCHWDLDQ
jgi:hypothetical protein